MEFKKHGTYIHLNIQRHELEKAVRFLSSRGYAVISRKFGIISRIDREDWHKLLPRGGAFSKKSEMADFYRRTLSKDQMQVPQSVAQLLARSSSATEDQYTTFIKDF